MTSPTLHSLPPPPSGKLGWPWTEGAPQRGVAMPDGSPWPRISIITPSFQQAQYLEETIRSVLLQGYPNLEYIVMDGGSTDGSVEVIRKYERWLTYWASEPDRGQSHAINKGFERCTGDLIGWLNSDDLLSSDALLHLAEAHRGNPSAVLFGDVENFREEPPFTQMVHQRNVTVEHLLIPWRTDIAWHQPGIYVPRALYAKIGGLDEDLRYIFDQDWFCRLLREAPAVYLHQLVARFRLHTASKTGGERGRWLAEKRVVLERHGGYIEGLNWRQARAELELRGALPFVSLDAPLKRGAALAHVISALKQDWKILFNTKNLALCAATLAPRGVVRLARRVYRADIGGW